MTLTFGSLTLKILEIYAFSLCLNFSTDIL